MPQFTQTSSKEPLLQVATELFIRNGFGPTGLDQIIDAVGVTKTTFYKHFESKDDLIVAVLRRQHEIEMRGIAADTEAIAGGNPKERILAIFDVLDAWFSEPNFRGCIFLNAVTEFPMKTDPIHIAAIKHGEQLGLFVRDNAIAAGADRESATLAAEQILMLIRGAVFSRQTANMIDAAKCAKPMVKILLESMLKT